jgi:hypothetical protein
MKTSHSLGASVLALLAAPAALAQQTPGWNVSWGLHSVPLSPALNVLLALMLGGATYWFLRKRGRGQALMGLLAVTAAGALLLPTDTAAVGYSLEIDTPTGSSFLECTGNTLYIGTSLPAGVTLSGVSPNFPDQPLTNSVSNVCRAGFQLTPSQNCQLACPLPNNG